MWVNIEHDPTSEKIAKAEYLMVGLMLAVLAALTALAHLPPA
jgi:hypothetical protein